MYVTTVLVTEETGMNKDNKEYQSRPDYGESILDAQISLHNDELINLILHFLSELPVQYSFYKMQE